MASIIKKFVSYTLIALVLFFSVIAILGIWGIVDFENIFYKTMGSLLVIFTSSAIVLFIFSVLIKDESNDKKESN